MSLVPLTFRGKAVIPLGRSFYAIIDADDWERVFPYMWRPSTVGAKRTRYAVTNGKNGDTVLMHRIVSDAPEGYVIDHDDGNGLHNWKGNLVVTDHQGNCQNWFARAGGYGKWGLRGVYLNSKGRRWAATINNRHIGMFDTKEDAARAYDRAAKELWGDRAALNFPDEAGGQVAHA